MTHITTDGPELNRLSAIAVFASILLFAFNSEVSAKGPKEKDDRNENSLKDSTNRGQSKKLLTNSPPVISGTPDGAVLENSHYGFTPEASDPDNDPLTFTIVNKPGWSLFDAGTGAIYGTPTMADVGLYESIEITVSDGWSSVSLPAFAIDVTSIASASVTLNWQPPTENTDGTPLTNLAGYRIYYGTDPDNLPNVIEIMNPGITTYLVENLIPDLWHFSATALNSEGVESDPASYVSYQAD